MNGPIDTTVCWLTFRQLFVRRRLIAALVFALAPALLALLFRLGHTGDQAASPRFLTQVYVEIVAGSLLPLVAVVFGTAAFGAEIDDGTVVYLLVKPLARWRVVMSKYVVAVAATAVVMVVALLVPWLVFGLGVIESTVPAAFAAGIALGAVLYGALFVMLGLISKRALMIGLLYIVVVEFVLSRQVAGVRSFSIREFVLAIVAKLAPGVAGIAPATVSNATVWTMSGIMLVGSLVMAIRWLGRYEMAERL